MAATGGAGSGQDDAIRPTLVAVQELVLERLNRRQVTGTKTRQHGTAKDGRTLEMVALAVESALNAARPVCRCVEDMPSAVSDGALLRSVLLGCTMYVGGKLCTKKELKIVHQTSKVEAFTGVGALVSPASPRRRGSVVASCGAAAEAVATVALSRNACRSVFECAARVYDSGTQAVAVTCPYSGGAGAKDPKTGNELLEQTIFNTVAAGVKLLQHEVSRQAVGQAKLKVCKDALAMLVGS